MIFEPKGVPQLEKMCTVQSKRLKLSHRTVTHRKGFSEFWKGTTDAVSFYIIWKMRRLSRLRRELFVIFPVSPFSKKYWKKKTPKNRNNHCFRIMKHAIQLRFAQYRVRFRSKMIQPAIYIVILQFGIESRYYSYDTYDTNNYDPNTHKIIHFILIR